MAHQWSIIQTLFTLSAVSLFALLYNTKKKRERKALFFRFIGLFQFLKHYAESLQTGILLFYFSD